MKSQIDRIHRYIVVRLDKRTTNYVLNIWEQKTDEIKLVPLILIIMKCPLRLLIVLVSKFNGIITHQCRRYWQMRIDIENGLDSRDMKIILSILVRPDDP